mmetsp:Transcript_4906/g.10534  ORF Transcript_4906/g.10534 Transcript_4906/m.10534 type:complete len:147 (-) Transcript_4906:683-1123(-)
MRLTICQSGPSTVLSAARISAFVVLKPGISLRRKCNSTVHVKAAASQYSGPNPGDAARPRVTQAVPQTPSWISGVQAALLAVVSLLQRFTAWVQSCREVLPQFYRPSLREALSRMGLILAVSLFMIVLVSSIDAAMLQFYVLTARR